MEKERWVNWHKEEHETFIQISSEHLYYPNEASIYSQEHQEVGIIVGSQNVV